MLASLPSNISVSGSDGNTIVVSIRSSPRSTRLRLVCGMTGAQVVVPALCTLEEVESFLMSRKNWLLRTFKYYEKLMLRCGRYESNVLYFQGEKYRFIVKKDRQNFVIVSTSLKVITFHLPDLRNVKKVIKDWYKSETTRLVSSRIPDLAAKYGLHYNRVSIKTMTSRWGSCSKLKNLNFSSLLSAAPSDVAEYVMIHELMHLIRLDHSKKFWELVEVADPEYKKHRDWLVDYAPVIKVS